jgi:hypothetical protein
MGSTAERGTGTEGGQMAKDVSDVIGTAVGHAARQAMHGISKDRIAAAIVTYRMLRT